MLTSFASTALEGKIVPRAVVEVLEAIYETDFKGFSYGFRPKRSTHHALDALAVGIQWRKMKWVFNADIRGFFDEIWPNGWKDSLSIGLRIDVLHGIFANGLRQGYSPAAITETGLAL